MIMEEIEEKEMPNLNIHHGRNIRRCRMKSGIKQDYLAELLHMSQSTVSKYENTREIDDATLLHFADALKVPFEYLKNLEETAQTVVFENITNNDHATTYGYLGDANNGANSIDNRVNNPIEKITELYERLLKEKDEKYAALEQRLRSVEESLQDK